MFISSGVSEVSRLLISSDCIVSSVGSFEI